jgi:hypothetical protein
MNNARRYAGGCGTQTLAITFAGGISPSGFTTATELWDGTNWISSTAVPGNRSLMGSAGTQTAALGFGGLTPTITNSTIEFTSTINVTTAAAWASGGNLNTTRSQLAGAGTQTASVGFGGSTPSETSATELYNGTSWTTNPTGLATARRTLAGCGTQTAALAFGGLIPSSDVTATEEFTGTTWSSGGSLGTARRNFSGCGLQTAALAFGGSGAPPPGIGLTAQSVTEKYNGTAWTSTGSLNTARYGLGGFGIDTAAIAMGGNINPGLSTATESFNGSTWTSVNSLNTSRDFLAGAGIQTLGVAFGGGPSFTAATEVWNGTSWTSAPPMATARYQLAGAGTQTAGLGFGGYTGSNTAATEEFTGEIVTTTASTLTTS